MERIPVGVDPPYEVQVGVAVLGALGDVVASAGERGTESVAIVSDPHVFGLHGWRLGALPDAPHFLVPRGEEAKTFTVLEGLLDFLVETNLDRGSTLVAFGGGAVSDVTGLAAALFLRGIRVVHCPTTLLAQVDAAVGGKTAVNLRGGKNLAGVFHQPSGVLAESGLIATLERDELRSGLGEVLKTALIGGEEVFQLVESRAADLVKAEPGALAEVITACVRVKARIVQRDEREAGERKLLNLGHTFAHGIEHAAGYGTVPHGVAVAVGIGRALEVARISSDLDPTLRDRVRALAEIFELPLDLDGLRREFTARVDPDSVLAAMRRDKKNRAGRTLLVVPRGVGRVDLDVEASDPLLLDVLEG